MTTGKTFLHSLGLGALLLVTACSSGGGGGGSEGGALSAASQDLTLDPTGLTTVLTFSRAVSSTLTPGNFEADSGQLPVSVSVDGDEATVAWDARVTPAHQVRAVGISGIPSDYVAVSTTDAAPPTLVISSGTQTTGLGGDSFSVQFSGANVVAATAEDPASWDLTIGGTSLDLSGSTFVFDAVAQSVAVSLGPEANLHASFALEGSGVLSVADVAVGGPYGGTASGDAIAPSLVSAIQSLSTSEFGFVVDFTFDEAMDPAVNPLAGFDAGFPIFATQYEQPTPEILRVTFTGPVIPGQDSVQLTGIVDAHGNPLPTQTTAIATGTTVANDYDTGPDVLTVENLGGDTVVATFLQALDPDTGGLPATWDLESPTGVDIDLSTATIDYDLLAKTLTITLTDDDLTTGDTWSFGPTGSPPVDVDGEVFAQATSGTVSGDVSAPSIVSVSQNRVLDPSGMTFEVEFSEDVDPAQAELTGNYTFTSGTGVTSATLLADDDTVRLVLDTQTLPGEHTLEVTGVSDIAGNALGALTGQALTSTDLTEPSVLFEAAYAESGPDNDTLTVVFDDELVASEVTDPNNWVFETPATLSIDTTNASVTWDPGIRTAVLTFDGGDGINLKGGVGYSLRFVTLRDIAGNVITPYAVLGTVESEMVYPEVTAVWVETADATQLHVRFDEPVEHFDDFWSPYVLRDAGGLDVGGGPPTVVVDADQMGARLTWAVGAVAGTHTLDVKGIADLAGNQMFPAELIPVLAEVASGPGLGAGLSEYLAVSGERNDTLSVVFAQPVSRWGLLDPANYDFTDGGDTADFSIASLAFDGVDRVDVVFDGSGSIDLDNGAYTLTVDGVLSAQGVAMGAPSLDTVNAGGTTDLVSASAIATRTRLDAADPTNSVLVELDEALDASEAVDTNNYTVGGVNPTSVTQLGPRTVRGTWAGVVTQGQMVNVTAADLAGNLGAVSEAIQAADTSGPAVVGVAGVVAPDTGGDCIDVTFGEPVPFGPATTASNYTVSSGGTTLDVSNAQLSYDAATNTVSIPVPVDLDEGDTVNVMVSGVPNHAGLVMSPANVNGAIAGDGVGPDFTEGFVNYRLDPLGQTVDLRFDEDVDAAFATDTGQYTFSGGQLVTSATLMRPDVVRLKLNRTLGTGDTVQLTGLPDLAGNLSGTIQVEPIR